VRFERFMQQSQKFAMICSGLFAIGGVFLPCNACKEMFMYFAFTSFGSWGTIGLLKVKYYKEQKEMKENEL